MKNNTPYIVPSLLAAIAVSLAGATAEANPLKVFIPAGQSNMQGHAQTRTCPEKVDTRCAWENTDHREP